MINSEENVGAGVLPLGITFAGRKKNDFEDMVFWIAEVKGFNACRGLVPRGQGLRSSRNVLCLLLAQLFVGFFHVAHHDGDMLKPMVVAL